MEQCYILFYSHEQAVALHREFRLNEIHSIISPTPRSVSKCCGVSLLIENSELEKVDAYLKNHKCIYRSIEKVRQDFSNHRDRYV